MAKHYVPDLTNFAKVCESNYMRLLTLLPEMDSGTGREFTITGGVGQRTGIRFSITEQFPYTLTIAIEQVSELHDFLQPPHMDVRLYHDVRMAEVVVFDHHHRFNGVYHYPNPQMRHPDEKHQINQFLADWLEHCLQHGEADIELNFQPKPLKCDSDTGSD
ncbi:MAG: hypothetical protein CL679_12880 [Bermanella sp.]|nr:hypothetical protein [Bermanella sp.]|tara:strand:+ start:1667 stop:2149 length:483 start_codon:yes stop_codon:yes gene_type:complete